MGRLWGRFVSLALVKQPVSNLESGCVELTTQPQYNLIATETTTHHRSGVDVVLYFFFKKFVLYSLKLRFNW